MGTDITHLTTLTPVSFLLERLLQKIAARQAYNASQLVELLFYSKSLPHKNIGQKIHLYRALRDSSKPYEV